MDRTFKLASKEALEQKHAYGASRYDEFLSVINSPIEEMSEEIFQRERLSTSNGPQSREWTYAAIHCLVCQEMLDCACAPFFFCGSCKYNTYKLLKKNNN